ncbi:MAG: AAA family ATPase [Defluviitaleaceae bacterium]|nr:AAA family ATPase [Defluviitaleaceae bacterium]
MEGHNELGWESLKYFADTDALAKSGVNDGGGNWLIGQKRAAEALSFGLKIKDKGYNLFICGAAGTGKTTFAKSFAEEIAKEEATPPDLCYVYNFENPKCPSLISLPAGKGRNMRDAVGEVMNRLTNELPKTFSNRDFEFKKSEIMKLFQSKRDEIIKEMTEEAREQHFGVKNTNNGIYFMPIIDGEMINEEQFEALSQEQKDNITVNSESVHKRAAEVMRQIREYEKKTRREVEDLEYTIGLFTVGRHMNAVMEDFSDEPEVVKYMKAVKEDILDNLSDFIADDSDEDEAIKDYLPWYTKKPADDIFTRYKVNLIADNTETSGAPVVVDFNPTYANLIGEIEYDNEFGNFSTDFMKIKPGLLHRANGGYLILQAQDLLMNTHAWEILRRTLITGQIVTEPIREYATGIAVSGVKPEPIPVSVKVIIVGNGWYYDLLYEYDDHFEKLFKIRVDFDYEMRLDKGNLEQIAQFVRGWAKTNGRPEFMPKAIGRLVEYSARLAERQDRLTTKFNRLVEIMAEASALSSGGGEAGNVTEGDVARAIAKREYRLNMYEEKLTELIEDDIVMIDTDGSKVGQINGLAVIDVGDYVFAKPSRITATTYMGKAGIINIEKEAEMSGSIHDKGVQVLIGYLGKTYAQEFPLSLSCRICFEQNYSGIDGDSASSTELYAVLSSLAGLPIRQDIAVTGSINQHGEIQPIGGVTYKIEGFFDLCARRGLTGRQGVIIPTRNVRDLTLKDEVVDAVREGLFHIYPVAHADEGIEILTGLPAGSPDGKDKFQFDSVHGRVYKRLRSLYKKATRGDE